MIPDWREGRSHLWDTRFRTPATDGGVMTGLVSGDLLVNAD
jgi:hypothetical protein